MLWQLCFMEVAGLKKGAGYKGEDAELREMMESDDKFVEGFKARVARLRLGWSESLAR